MAVQVADSPSSSLGIKEEPVSTSDFELLFANFDDALHKRLNLYIGTDGFVARCARALLTTLRAKLPVATITCEKCFLTHLDEGKFAVRRHSPHLCLRCEADIVVDVDKIGNPLAFFSPRLVNNKIAFSLKRAYIEV